MFPFTSLILSARPLNDVAITPTCVVPFGTLNAYEKHFEPSNEGFKSSVELNFVFVNPLASAERKSSPSLRGICAVNERKFKKAEEEEEDILFFCFIILLLLLCVCVCFCVFLCVTF